MLYTAQNCPTLWSASRQPHVNQPLPRYFGKEFQTWGHQARHVPAGTPISEDAGRDLIHPHGNRSEPVERGGRRHFTAE